MYCLISVQTVILGVEVLPIVPIYGIHIASLCFLQVINKQSEFRTLVQTDTSQDPSKSEQVS